MLPQGAPAAAAGGTGMPQAAAYFPLTSGNLTSAFPAGRYEGQGVNLGWREDAAFGRVLECDEVRGRFVF